MQFATSQVKSRFLDNVDMNNSLLNRDASKQSINLRDSSLKKKTMEVTYNCSRSRMSIQKNKDNF